MLDESEIVQGRILWLPPKEELPEKAVRRAHGKGAVEEGIHNHPVVVISRPTHESSVVHFHIITSFQGKKLHEIYGKANEFHQSRRSWYLPISPTPPHPDANSKKSKKRFPNLELAGGAVLRWDSYVNLRDVYKIDWSLLRSYGNPDTPYSLDYRFERESMIRLLAKGKLLTTYEAGTQYQTATPGRIPKSPRSTASGTYRTDIHSPTKSDTPSIPSSPISVTLQRQQSDFLGPRPDTLVIIRRPPKAPPEGENPENGSGVIRYIVKYLLGWPWEVLKRVWARVWERGNPET
ncbi:hypothetical protein K469DRAFT_726731 [Zopfia rhizophila CBS 207.26]|uniref:Uncharacterized protein n=1 Tax=Zopfia rhizophila CBS 207.26 TaxID=1314779 RepID=A0A6A6E1H5_9PEZI|nr:hypothetical protein K469DRAFT_726731 [Zopfia rhizophila CBS 207.26]